MLKPISLSLLIAYSCIFLILIIGSIASRLLVRRYPHRDYSNLEQRIQVWWFIVPALILTITLGNRAITLLFMFISYQGLNEYFLLIKQNTPLKHILLQRLFYLLLIIQYFLAYCGHPAFTWFIPFLCLLFVLTGILSPSGQQQNTGMLYGLGLILVIYSFSHIVRLQKRYHQEGLLIFLLIVTQLNDVAQYTWGKLLGKRALAPKISPNKTLEGFIGGIVSVSLLSMLLAPLLTPLTPTAGLFAGILLCLTGTSGDLIISCLKRSAQVKDTGNFLPGHGGMLDRVDSLIFSAPFFYYYMLLMQKYNMS